MPLQYMSDYNGKPTAVVIPIKEWEKLVNKYTELKKLIPFKDNKNAIPLMREYEGLLSVKEGKSLLKYVEQSRSEWDR